jgi:hypothetical protein
VVRSGFPNTYLTFYKESTEDYFRVADNSERTNYTDSANRQRCTPGLGLCLATIQRLTRSHVCDKFIDLLQNPICRHEAEVVRTC